MVQVAGMTGRGEKPNTFLIYFYQVFVTFFSVSNNEQWFF